MENSNSQRVADRSAPSYYGSFAMEGQITGFKLRSQKVWWKPWTWRKKPIKEITGFTPTGASLVSKP